MSVTAPVTRQRLAGRCPDERGKYGRVSGAWHEASFVDAARCPHHSVSDLSLLLFEGEARGAGVVMQGSILRDERAHGARHEPRDVTHGCDRTGAGW